MWSQQTMNSCMTDILEISQKMEADLLESHSTVYLSSGNFSSRITRSQTVKLQNVKAVNPPIDMSEPERKLKDVDIEKLYLNKKAKVVHNKLETIYEYPLWKKGNAVLLGNAKVKRSIYFNREFRITSKQKSKSRKMKIKRLGNKKLRHFKISDEEFKNKMLSIENFINEDEEELNSKSDNLEDCNTAVS